MRQSNVGDRGSGNGAIGVWVVLLFGITLLGAAPYIFGGLRLDQLSPGTPLFPAALAGVLLASFAPTIAALLVAGWLPGGLRDLFRQWRTRRIAISWYALAIIGPIVLFLLADAIEIAAGVKLPPRWFTVPPASDFGPGGLAFLAGRLFFSMIQEEPGWRGFVQPRLQKRYGALKASFVVGILWSTWHLYPMITPGGLAAETPADVLATYIRLTSTAVIYAWMYNNTNGSLFLVGVAHAGHNLAATLMRTPPHLTIALLYLAAAVVVVALSDPRTLRRPWRGPFRGNTSRL